MQVAFHSVSDAAIADAPSSAVALHDVELGHASKETLVTVEKLVDGNLLDDEARAGSVLPAMYVSHIALAPQGAWPLPLQGSYGGDSAVLAAYASAARTDEGFATQLTELMEAARLRWGVAALLRAAAAPIQPA